jgi:hypothetical protein
MQIPNGPLGDKQPFCSEIVVEFFALNAATTLSDIASAVLNERDLQREVHCLPSEYRRPFRVAISAPLEWPWASATAPESLPAQARERQGARFPDWAPYL